MMIIIEFEQQERPFWNNDVAVETTTPTDTKRTVTPPIFEAVSLSDLYISRPFFRRGTDVGREGCIFIQLPFETLRDLYPLSSLTAK